MKKIFIKIFKILAILLLFLYSFLLFLGAYLDLKYQLWDDVSIEFLKMFAYPYFYKLWGCLSVILIVVLSIFYKNFKNWKYTRLFLWIFPVVQIVIIGVQWIILNYSIENLEVDNIIYDIIYPMTNFLFYIFLFYISSVLMIKSARVFQQKWIKK